MQLNLKANTPAEQRILEYLQNTASETLAEKINNGTPFEKDGNPLADYFIIVVHRFQNVAFADYFCRRAHLFFTRVVIPYVSQIFSDCFKTFHI